MKKYEVIYYSISSRTGKITKIPIIAYKTNWHICALIFAHIMSRVQKTILAHHHIEINRYEKLKYYYTFLHCIEFLPTINK